MNLSEAIELVTEAAEHWAGEYGFSPGMKDYCNDIFKAVNMIRTEFSHDI